MTKNNTKSYSFPFFSILGLIFITLKLMGEITWSWWWVLSPFWGPIAFVLVIMLIGLLLVGVGSYLEKK